MRLSPSRCRSSWPVKGDSRKRRDSSASSGGIIFRIKSCCLRTEVRASTGWLSILRPSGRLGQFRENRLLTCAAISPAIYPSRSRNSWRGFWRAFEGEKQEVQELQEFRSQDVKACGLKNILDA